MVILHSNKYTAPNVHIRTNKHTNQKVLKNKPQIHRQDGKVYFILRSDLDNAKQYCLRPLVSYKGNWPRLAFLWARVKEITAFLWARVKEITAFLWARVKEITAFLWARVKEITND